ncbi:hypothetical protein GOBAR_AA35334 [Gossypium barbadense]|uniref:Uncharacterized protein n=1 Tax=Gossypium barbadense TaxID=3634 RepID=A0A2P5W2R7_GOSBA|nr:hypothetical protein GOBAR_AA35334 [Gossypium barbadense]
MVHEYELIVRANLPPNFESVGPAEEWGQIGAMVQVVATVITFQWLMPFVLMADHGGLIDVVVVHKWISKFVAFPLIVGYVSSISMKNWKNF